MSRSAQLDSFPPLGGDPGEGELPPLTPSPDANVDTIPGVGFAGGVDSYEIFGDSLHLTDKFLESYLQK